MARTASFQEGDLRSYYLGKQRKGLHYLAAVTAVALKLCHVTWRILTDQRDYVRERPPKT